LFCEVFNQEARAAVAEKADRTVYNAFNDHLDDNTPIFVAT